MMSQKQESPKKASRAVKGHVGIMTIIKSSGWVKGKEFKNKMLKFRAKTAVLEQLETSTNMEITKAELVLLSVVTDFQQEGLNESNLVSEEVGRQNEVLESVFHNISSYTKSLSARLILNTARLLTGLTAVLAPQPHSETGKVLSSRKVGNILGLNRQAKYFTTGIVN